MKKVINAAKMRILTFTEDIRHVSIQFYCCQNEIKTIRYGEAKQFKYCPYCGKKQ